MYLCCTCTRQSNVSRHSVRDGIIITIVIVIKIIIIIDRYMRRYDIIEERENYNTNNISPYNG